MYAFLKQNFYHSAAVVVGVARKACILYDARYNTGGFNRTNAEYAGAPVPVADKLAVMVMTSLASPLLLPFQLCKDLRDFEISSMGWYETYPHHYNKPSVEYGSIFDLFLK